MLNSTTEVHPPNTWWPDLYFHLKPVVVGVQHLDRGSVQMQGFWACPGHQRRNHERACGDVQDYFCKSLSCATSGDGRGSQRWEAGSRDLLTFSFVVPSTLICEESCNVVQVRIRFNREAANKERSWPSGLSWGIQIQTYGTRQRHRVIMVSQIIEPIQVHNIGPNLVKKINPTPSHAMLGFTSSTPPSLRALSPDAGRSDPL